MFVNLRIHDHEFEHTIQRPTVLTAALHTQAQLVTVLATGAYLTNSMF